MEAKRCRCSRCILQTSTKWQTCIHLSASTCCGRYVPVARQGSVRDQTQKVGTSKERPTSGPVLSVDVSLCLDLQVGLRLWISPGRLWKHSFFPFASHCPINAYDPQNGFLTSRKGIRPNSSPVEQSVPNGHKIYPGHSGAFSGSELESIVVAGPRSRLRRDNSVATIGIRPPDNAVHGENCLVLQSRLRRSVLNHKPFHRHCWSEIEKRLPTRASQEAPHTVH